MSPLVAVTGATGVVGGRVATLLSERGVAQRLVVRDADRAPELPGATVRVAPDYGDQEAMRAALDGATTLFLVPGAEAEDRLRRHVSAVAAAAQAGVRHVVYLSFVAAAADTTFTLGRDHWGTEEALRASGMAWTFARMNLYTDFLPLLAGVDGAIRGPAGDGRAATVTRADVAEAVAAILCGDGHEGRTYELTGPAAHSLAETADLLTRAAGRPVRYVPETIAEAYASRAHLGAPHWEVTAWISSYLAIGAGDLMAVSGDVEALIGRPPADQAAWFAAHPEALTVLRR